jgi:hypothetical protein
MMVSTEADENRKLDRARTQQTSLPQAQKKIGPDPKATAGCEAEAETKTNRR